MSEIEYQQPISSEKRGVRWNPWNKVVQSHDDGTISYSLTNTVRARLGLPVPWTPEIASTELSNGTYIGKPYG